MHWQATSAIDQAVEQLEKKHQGLIGVVVLRRHSPAVLRSTFPDTSRTLHYARLAQSVLDAAQHDVAEGDGDEVTLLRVRTHTSEVVVTPENGFVLVAVHSTATSV